MFCTKCGNNLDEGAKFCNKCGSPVMRGRSRAGSAGATGRNVGVNGRGSAGQNGSYGGAGGGQRAQYSGAQNVRQSGSQAGVGGKKRNKKNFVIGVVAVAAAAVIALVLILGNSGGEFKRLESAFRQVFITDSLDYSVDITISGTTVSIDGESHLDARSMSVTCDFDAWSSYGDRSNDNEIYASIDDGEFYFSVNFDGNTESWSYELENLRNSGNYWPASVFKDIWSALSGLDYNVGETLLFYCIPQVHAGIFDYSSTGSAFSDTEMSAMIQSAKQMLTDTSVLADVYGYSTYKSGGTTYYKFKPDFEEIQELLHETAPAIWDDASYYDDIYYYYSGLSVEIGLEDSGEISIEISNLPGVGGSIDAEFSKGD